MGKFSKEQLRILLYQAFWEAGRRTNNDETIHGMDSVYFDEEMDMIDTSGGGMPNQFWGHFADAWIEQEKRYSGQTTA